MSKINNLGSLFQNPFLLYHEPLSYGEPGYQEARDFASTVCPVGSNAEFIEDSWQQTDKYGRALGLVYCNDMFLNELLLTNGHAEISTYFCD